MEETIAPMIRAARDFFGNNTKAWEDYWHMMVLDPALFLEAIHKLPYTASQLGALSELATLFLHHDDKHPLYHDKHNVPFVIENYLNQKAERLPSIAHYPEAFLTIAITRFHGALIKHWLNCKNIPSSLNTPHAGLADYQRLRDSMQNAHKPDFHFHEGLNNYNKHTPPAHPQKVLSWHARIRRNLLWLILSLWEGIYRFCFPPKSAAVAPQERSNYLKSLHFTSNEIRSLHAHGLFDTSMSTTYYDDRRIYPHNERKRSEHGLDIFTNHCPKINRMP
jgi:hypothetical protein